MKRKITLNLDQLIKMFSPPVFESDDMKTRQANLINGLLQGFLLVTLCFGVLGSLVVYKRFTIQTVIMLLLTVALVGVYRLLKKGYVQFAGTTLIVLLWSLFTVAIVLLGGVHSPAFAGYIVVALIAGLLQGPRQTLVLVVMSILSGVGTIIGEMNGLLVYPIPHPLAGVLMAYAFLLMMTAVIINLDVSSRRQAEQALRESEQRFRGVLEQSQDGIAVNDEKGILITWNATMEKISGLPVADVLGRPIWDVQYQMLAPEDQFEERRKGLQIGLQSFLETGTSPWANQLLEREYMRPDGKKLYVQGITFPIQTERGFMLGSITRDISSQKQAEQALRKSEENYRTLFDEASDAILVLDVQSNILDVNKRTSELLGISHDELLQRNALEFLHEDDVKNKDHEATLAPLMAGKTIQSDYRLQREDGSYVPTELSTKMLDENRFLNIARDLTERLAAEKALRESEERYRLLVDESPYAIGIHQEGKIVYMNPAAVCLLGAKTADELVGLPIEQIIAHENWEAAQARIERMLQGETGLYPTEDRYLRLDGVVVPVEVTAVPFTHKGKPAIQVIALDISQRKQAEQGLAEALAKWESLVQNAPNFIAILDRDYRLQYVNHIQPGFQREDVIGSSTFAYADPEYHDTIRQKIDHVFHTGEAVRYEILGQGPHGETTWYETWVGPLIMDGAIAFVTLISSEITERKQTEEALQQQQERLEEAEKFAKLGSWDLPVGSSDGWWSKQMFELLGFNPTMGIPDIEDYLAAIHPDDRYLVKNALTMMSQGQEPDSEVYRSNPERGSLRYFRPTVHCQKDAEGNPVKFVGTLLDITERKLADDALQQYTQRLETLRQIDGAILSAQSKEEIAHAALGHVYELIPCRRVAVTEVDLASGLMTILASYQDENSEVEIGKQVSAPNEAFVAQISQGHPVIIDDLLQYTDRPEVAALYEMGIRTYLVIPLIAQGELIGGITFGADKPGAISKADIAVVQQVADHLAIALQQARLVELIQNRLQELITLQQASLTFTRLLSPAKIGQKVIEIIEAELNYKRGAIFTLSETGDSLELLAHSSLGFESHEMRAELSRVRSLVAGGKGISAWVAFHGEVVRSGDIKQDPRYVEADPHINSELCVPLQVGGKTIGSLNVESEKRDAFNEHDERLLMTLASQTAVALANARLYDAEKAQRDLAEALRDTAVSINSVRMEADVWDAVMANLSYHIDHDIRDLGMVEDDMTWVVRAEGRMDVDLGAWIKNSRLLVSETLPLKRMVDTGETIYIPDVHQDEDWVFIPGREWIRAYIGAPIRIKNQIVGFISLFSAQPNQFSAEDARHLEGFAEQAAIGIEKARLIASLEQQTLELEKRVENRTQSLAQQYARQAALAEIELAISEPDELQAVLERIARLVHDYLPVSGGASVILWDESTGRFNISASTIPTQDAQLASKRVRRKNGATRWIVEHKKPLFVTDIQNDPFGANTMLVEYGLRAYAGIPILDGQTVLGVLYVLESKIREYSKEDVEFLQILAARASVVILKARLFEEIKETNVLLARRSQELEMRNQELETFTYSVSHDLKAPLRGIDGYSRLLLEDYEDQLDEDGRFFLNNVRNATRNMNELINDLLLYSRLERRRLQAGTIIPRMLIESLLMERADEVAESGAEVKVGGLETAVIADPDGLTMALRNLLDNALKFTRDTPQPVIEIGGHETETSCIIWVQDNGKGFDMKFHDRIFEIFQRLHRAEEYPGTGVGLAIVQKAMQRMNGRVWAEGEPDQGATFYLEIPKNK